ncbi:eukaryotic mitochondrial regulator protein-domain-containing protein [Tuber brumale]|nr:eukaryotic mitochondrial regulator protein-domain-containing protein [Tuber brumale]
MPPRPPPMATIAKRTFGTSTALQKGPSSARGAMFAWLSGPGTVFKQPTGEPQYISSYDRSTWERKDKTRNPEAFVQPYPFNRYFKSQPVLSDAFREEIYARVKRQNHSIRQVSAALNVSIERVAAVVRLKQVEKEHVARGGKLSTFLTKALDQMLPVTDAPNLIDGRSGSGSGGGGGGVAFENVQELPIHSLAGRQAFVQTSESREFTRADAGKEFGLPAADVMVPHPDLVTLAKERFEDVPLLKRTARQEERDRLNKSRREAEKERSDEKKRKKKVLEVGRWKWCLTEAETGKVGFRYGFPLPDRKKGHVKIPTHIS